MTSEPSHNNNLLKWALLSISTLLFVVFVAIHPKEVYQVDSGKIFATEYHITYCSEINYKQDIEKELKKFDSSVSMFNDTSVITKVNKGDKVVLDDNFLNVFRKAQQVSVQTLGAFDVTVAPLVNLWGFGLNKRQQVKPAMVDSVMQFVGYKKVYLQNAQIVKKDPRVMLDFSAIAKGYAVDVIARLLERRGVSNYMVEIGGEIVVRGKSPVQKDRDDRLWHIGISSPLDDALLANQSLQTVLQLTDKGMATSGNYRKFYYSLGKKYAHTINPITGYPVCHSLLSATVIANDCMTADAFATAFMVMGVDKAKAFAESHASIDAYFIYVDHKGVLRSCQTSGMKRYFLADEEE